MGIEYRISFTFADKSRIDGAVRHLPGLRKAVPPWDGFDWEAPDRDTGGLPDAHFEVESAGVYFVDNGGRGREFLGILVARLVSEFGQVRVEEL